MIPKFTWKSEFRQNYYRISFSPTVPPFAARISRVVADGGTWRLKWERLKAGESNGKLPPRTCPGCSVSEPYPPRDWALVPAKPCVQGWMNEWMNERTSCCVLKLQDNKIVSGSSPHDNLLFYFYLDDYMFRPLDHHQAIFTRESGKMQCK